MRIIILSKNRAAQAELLLRSVKEQVSGWQDFFITVFYDYDDKKYEQGYALLKEIHPEFHYHRKDPEKPLLNEQFMELISMKKKDFFSFFADDLVVIRPFSKNDKQFKIFKERKDILALSLRLNPGVDYSQPLERKTFPPKIDRDGVFCWYKTNFEYFLEQNMISRLLRKIGLSIFMRIEGDWAYQMILDGNVYHFEEFINYFATLPDFSYAPDIEVIMSKSPLPERKVILYPESRIISVASNKIDKGYFGFANMGEDPATINDKFLNGGRLSYDHLKNLDNTSCHLKMPLSWQ